MMLVLTIHSLTLNTQLAAYAQKHENITILTHLLDHTHHTHPFFNFALTL